MLDKKTPRYHPPLHNRDFLEAQTMDSHALTGDRFARLTERTAKTMGWGATDAAMGLISRYLDETTTLVKEVLETQAKGGRGGLLKDTIADLKRLDPELIAVAVLQASISSVADCASIVPLLKNIGSTIENEIYAEKLLNWDAHKAKIIADNAKKRHQSMVYRKTAAKRLAYKLGFRWIPWDDRYRVIVGKVFLEVLLDGSVLIMVDEPTTHVTITEEALSLSQDLVAYLMGRHPVLLPSTEPLDPWTNGHTHIHGFRQPLVRKEDHHVQRLIGRSIKDGSLKPTLDALNAIQDVPWVIDPFILDMVEWSYQHDVKVEGIPPRKDLDRPDRPEDPNEDQALLWKKQVHEVLEMNRTYLGNRMVLGNDLAAAKHLSGAPFYVGHNLDYRGRVYGMSFFNFQRLDYVRGMFRFAQGKPVGDQGLYWLMVHTANVGDFGKVSKKPFADRVEWVINHMGEINECASDPKTYRMWTEADAPFQFLAACRELVKVLDDPSYESALPLGWDGSCSGLQHLAAMTRAPEGSLVNLTPSEQPQDVYQVVADLTKAKMESEIDDPEKVELAKACLAHGVGRSLVKRNVMTFAYSSKQFGMTHQHMEDTMRPLHWAVVAGDLEQHPLVTSHDTFKTKEGVEVTNEGYGCAKYLSKHIYQTIKEVVSLPAEAMAFLQNVSRALSHEDIPTTWRTPLGFPVMLRYPNYEIKRIDLWLSDKGVKRNIRPRLQEETKGLDKRKTASAVAPGFVHSLDACHLLMTVNRSVSEGITNLALVHDSFGCLAADAEHFRSIIREEFHALYANNDVLADILAEASSKVFRKQSLPSLPIYGSLDINLVKEAQYAFA